MNIKPTDIIRIGGKALGPKQWTTVTRRKDGAELRANYGSEVVAGEIQNPEYYIKTQRAELVKAAAATKETKNK